jgi:hypothetical protein
LAPIQGEGIKGGLLQKKIWWCQNKGVSLYSKSIKKNTTMTKQIILDNIRNGFQKIGQNTYKGYTIITCQKDEQFYAMVFDGDELQFNTPKYDCPTLSKEVAKAFIVKGSKPTPTQINKIKAELNSTTTIKTPKAKAKKEVVEMFEELPFPFGIF